MRPRGPGQVKRARATKPHRKAPASYRVCVDTPGAEDHLDSMSVLDAQQQQLNASADGLLRESLEVVAQTAVNEALESLPEVVARRVKGRRYLVSVSEVGDPDRDGRRGDDSPRA